MNGPALGEKAPIDRHVEAHESFGARIRRLRRARGLSLRGLALRLGRDHTLVLRWERGEREPTVWDVAAMARVLGATPDDLLAGARLAGNRAWSSRAHPPGPRRRLGLLLAASRRRLRLDAWDVYRATGIDGRRLLAIERGADPSLAEARGLIGLCGLRLAEILPRVSLDVPEVLPRVWRSTTPDPAGAEAIATVVRAR